MNIASVRTDLRIIAGRIPEGSRVLDLGCGSGELLGWLFHKRNCTGLGVEREPSLVLAAISAGVPVIDLDIDTQLDQFARDSFDVVVLSRTLQAVLRPDRTLQAMRQIAPWIVLTMPNFGYWRHRLRLLNGHMPRSRDLPFNWYETPNLHHSTLVDLEPLFDQVGLKIARRIPLAASGRPLRAGGIGANVRAGAAIYMLCRRDLDPLA